MLRFIVATLGITLAICSHAQEPVHQECGSLDTVSEEDVIFQSSPPFFPVQSAFTALKPRKDIKTFLVVFHDKTGSVFQATVEPATRHKYLNQQLVKWGQGLKFSGGKCGKAVMPITLIAKPD